MEDTIKINVSQTAWTDVTDGAIEGLITNNSEHSIRYRVADVAPIVSDTFGHILHPQAETYFNLEPSQKVYALSFQHGSRVALTKNFKTPILTKTEMTVADGPDLDAFQRQRVANPAPVFENKNIHDRKRSQWEEPIIGVILVHGAVTGGPFQVGEIVSGNTSGTRLTVTTVNAGSLIGDLNHNDYIDGETLTGQTSGATATLTTHNTGSDVYHLRDTASVVLKVGDTTGNKAVRQTHRYFSYVPGKSHEIWLTFCWGANGVVSFVKRSKDTGSVVNDIIPQSEWNLDRMDGSGPSGINLRFLNEMFIVIDKQWQGTGRVRMGFFHNGRIIYAHEFNFSNTLSSVYMSTPSLPVKHEIENLDGTNIERRSGYFNGDNGLFIKQISSDASRIMKETCSSIVSIGGQNPVGLGFSVSNEVTARTINAGAYTPMIAVRIKAVHPEGGENRVTGQFVTASVFPVGNSASFIVYHVHDPTDIVATWQNVGPGSAAEFSTDITSFAGNPSHKIIDGYAGAGAAGKGNVEDIRPVDKADQHRFISQNFDSTNSEMFVVLGQAIAGGTTTGYATMAWVEFD